ncbi:MAG: alanyl-tRNA editing protein [Aestuariivirga sp.]
MTALLFREDAYLKSAGAVVQSISERGGIVLDQTNFYAAAGGQPGDKGVLHFEDKAVEIATTVYDDVKNLVHVATNAEHLPAVGTPVRLELDWATRHRNMRAHTMMHLLCACVPFPVTGGAISEDGGRIDFDIPEGGIPDKEELAARINQLILDDHKVTFRWISDAEMEANLHLVCTMSVKPPMGTGKIRLVMIGEEGKVDLQPCGGTHVKSTNEIGSIRVGKIENKGKINRRIRLAFA